MAIQEIMIAGFTLIFVLMGILLKMMHNGFSLVHAEIKDVRSEIKDVRSEIKDMRTEIKDLRTSINRMEGAFYSKECCMLKDEKQMKKAE